jgi:hypothetical protein
MDWLVFAVCFTIILLLDEQRDRIKANKSTWADKSWFPKSLKNWWTENRWENRSWIVKNVLSFLLDGWHYCKFFQMLITWFLVSYLFTGSALYGFGGAINLQLLYGWIFNYLHKRK